MLEFFTDLIRTGARIKSFAKSTRNFSVGLEMNRPQHKQIETKISDAKKRSGLVLSRTQRGKVTTFILNRDFMQPQRDSDIHTIRLNEKWSKAFQDALEYVEKQYRTI